MGCSGWIFSNLTHTSPRGKYYCSVKDYQHRFTNQQLATLASTQQSCCYDCYCSNGVLYCRHGTSRSQRYSLPKTNRLHTNTKVEVQSILHNGCDTIAIFVVQMSLSARPLCCLRNSCVTLLSNWLYFSLCKQILSQLPLHLPGDNMGDTC